MAQDDGFIAATGDFNLRWLVFLPSEVDLMAAACAQPVDFSLGPSGRQCGHDVEDALALGVGALALEKHFRDSGGAAEVAVDLERWMEAEQVGSTAADEHAVEFVRAGAVAETRPEARFPSHGPTGGCVAACFQSGTCALEQLGCAGVDFIARMQSPEVGYVAVIDLGFLELADPLEDASVFAEPCRRELGAGFIEPFGERFIATGGAQCGGGVGEQAAQDLHIVGGAVCEGGLLVLAGFRVRKAVVVFR